ncbi:MAG: hypothetical protein HKL80_09185 [Acidimicrobiales bacterium]|nr:hypothetical protein [Acidimicrobiales bacterium]
MPDEDTFLFDENDIPHWISDGMTIGSHSLDHINLAEQDLVTCERQGRESKVILEKTGRS